jgi:hypothetical protein
MTNTWWPDAIDRPLWRPEPEDDVERCGSPRTRGTRPCPEDRRPQASPRGPEEGIRPCSAVAEELLRQKL